MYSHLLKRAVPFTLTFVLGAALGGLFGSFGAGGRSASALEGRDRAFGHGRGNACRMRRYNLVAETKPLVILFKPDALVPRGPGAEGPGSARVLVTFGADGRVQAVEPLDDRSVEAWRDRPAPGADAAWRAVERAARQIRFLPETINGKPVSVTKEVEIRFLAD